MTSWDDLLRNDKALPAGFVPQSRRSARVPGQLTRTGRNHKLATYTYGPCLARATILWTPTLEGAFDQLILSSTKVSFDGLPSTHVIFWRSSVHSHLAAGIMVTLPGIAGQI